MHHPRAAEFDPAGAFARAAAVAFESAGAVTLEAREVELRRRLGEREVRRAKTRDGVFAEQALQPLGHRALQMGHRNAFIDAKTFDLMEHRHVRHVRRVASEDLSRGDDAYRYAAALHCTDLHGRGL